MTHERLQINPGLRAFLPVIAPVLAIGGARWAAQSDLALAFPRLTAALFLWIAADSLTLSLIARAPGRKPAAQAVLASLAGACLVVALGAPASVRTGLEAMPGLIAVMALVVCAHAGWGIQRAASKPGERWRRLAGTFMPERLLHLAGAELRILRMALLGWRESPDVPAGTRGFSYHRYLAPMMMVLLVLQAMEIAGTDLLIRKLWSPFAATVLTEIGALGFLYMIGVIHSLRLRPILLTGDGLHLRAGILREQFLPYAQIAGMAPEVDGAEVRSRATLNMALLAWPNVVVRLKTPLPPPRFLYWRPARTAVAFKVDEPELFLKAMAWELGKRSA